MLLLLQVFQIVSQAIVQNFFPRFHIYHTSRKHKGQVQWHAFRGRTASAVCGNGLSWTRVTTLH